MKKKLAKLTSNILNPFLVSLVVIVLISLDSTSSLFDALKWSLIAIALTILPVFGVILFLVRKGKIDGIFISIREQRYRIYLLASTCAILSWAVLTYLGAPLALVAAFVSGLSAIIIFMCINLWWKISVHTAFISGSVTVMIILYGVAGIAIAVLLPLITWSRIELEHHSLAQAATGAVLAALVAAIVFYLFGLIGPVASI